MSESEMVNRLAGVLDAVVDAPKDYARRCAIAKLLIAAMREPTDAMCKKGYEVENPDGGDVGFYAAGNVWELMIDEALR